MPDTPCSSRPGSLGAPLPLLDTAAAVADNSVAHERSDAARNRQALLEAATRLAGEEGVAALTMDRLAHTAGVGKGTVFRRFGSRAGLMHALLDHSEREFQTAFLCGPPPLGPGAPPVDRLVAFGRAKLDLFDIQGELEAEAARIRFVSPPYQAHVAHVRMLLAEAGTLGHLRLLTDSLLGTLDPALVLHQTRELGITLSQIADNWERVVRRVVGDGR